jgi:hypothetical protein
LFWGQELTSNKREGIMRFLSVFMAVSIVATAISGLGPGQFAEGQATQAWASRYNGPGNLYDQAYAVVVDPGGYVYVTGASWGVGPTSDYATVKYNNGGTQLWAAKYNSGVGSSYDVASALAVDDLGNVYVTGYISGSPSGDDYYTIKYDQDGNERWHATYNGPPGTAWDRPYAIAVDPAGSVYVTGRSDQSGTCPYNAGYATIKYDSAGNQRWVARYNGPPTNGDDYAKALALDGGGTCL